MNLITEVDEILNKINIIQDLLENTTDPVKIDDLQYNMDLLKLDLRECNLKCKLEKGLTKELIEEQGVIDAERDLILRKQASVKQINNEEKLPEYNLSSEFIVAKDTGETIDIRDLSINEKIETIYRYTGVAITFEDPVLQNKKQERLERYLSNLQKRYSEEQLVAFLDTNWQQTISEYYSRGYDIITNAKITSIISKVDAEKGLDDKKEDKEAVDDQPHKDSNDKDNKKPIFTTDIFNDPALKPFVKNGYIDLTEYEDQSKSPKGTVDDPTMDQKETSMSFFSNNQIMRELSFVLKKKLDESIHVDLADVINCLYDKINDPDMVASRKNCTVEEITNAMNSVYDSLIKTNGKYVRKHIVDTYKPLIGDDALNKGETYLQGVLDGVSLKNQGLKKDFLKTANAAAELLNGDEKLNEKTRQEILDRLDVKFAKDNDDSEMLTITNKNNDTIYDVAFKLMVCKKTGISAKISYNGKSYDTNNFENELKLLDTKEEQEKEKANSNKLVEYQKKINDLDAENIRLKKSIEMRDESIKSLRDDIKNIMDHAKENNGTPEYTSEEKPKSL